MYRRRRRCVRPAKTVPRFALIAGATAQYCIEPDKNYARKNGDRDDDQKL